MLLQYMNGGEHWATGKTPPKEKGFSDPFFVRNLVYGAEDSLISTTGVVVGVAVAGFPHHHIIITGIILIVVEAMSMAFGSFVSEDHFMDTAEMKYSTADIVTYATVMFLSYALAGLIPLLPFLLNIKAAWQTSLMLAVIAMYALLYMFQKRPVKAMAQTSVGAVILAISAIMGAYFT
jgi:VIT1/CCC1 family predicted Fe2+/Mn2+ transporter